MRDGRIVTIIVWGVWSAVVAAGIVCLGANTEPYQARWPQAALTGAALGAVGGLLCRLAWGHRSGAALLGLPFGLVLGFGATVLFSGK